jgi:hypothetical protein
MATNPKVEDYLPLLRTQQNSAFRWVQESGFDPGAFEVAPGLWGKTPCTRFALTNSPYFFDVSTARFNYSVRHSPGGSELLTTLSSFSTEFEAVERPFKAWLSYLRREVEAPDLWALVRDGASMFAPVGAATSNDPFTLTEIRQIELAIEVGRSYLTEAGVAGTALAQANLKLDYLVESARRSGRMDWYNIAFSVLFGIAIAVLFDPKRAQELIEVVFRAVGQMQLR